MPQGRPSRKTKEAAKETFKTAGGVGQEEQEDVPSDAADPPSEISVPEQAESDSDFEEPAKGTKGKKRGAKKDGEGTGKKARRATPGGRDAAGRRKRDDQDSEGSLFELVKAGKVALQTIVDDWIESYKQDRDSALLELIQFFIQCSGCRGRITPQMYASMEHAEVIRKMTEEFDEESGDYPLIMSGPIWKKFKTNFCEFILVLVKQCQYSIIYDQYMMDSVISLLTGLTDSQVRAFRHTSTLASMKLMTALVEVALYLSINLDNTQRQYEAERQKGQSKRASERLEMLMAKRQEIEENQEEVRNMLTYIFKGVFVHRYRDTQAEIRAICMGEIGVWMKRYPNMFLDDAYLKYVGWTLYDRTGDVRLCCLKGLQPLYETTELSSKLELFTNRFKDRIVEMALDKEYEVAVAGVKLLISILRNGATMLSDKDCESVYELVYSSHRGVAQAAGEFLNVKLFTREPDEAIKVLKTKKGKKRSENTPYIRDLVQFFIESELHEHGAYLVDALWDINNMLKDWECMTDLLLEEPGRGEEPMDDRQETSLVEIMVCCIRQAATGEYPVGRGSGNRKLTARESKQVLEDKTKLTEHFIVALPQLLAKYAVDAEKVSNLLQIPQYFDLEIYTTSRQERQLEILLRQIADIVDKHVEPETLENCARVMECLCNEEYAICGKCNVARSTLIDSLVQQFKENYQRYFQRGEEPDDNDAYALLASLKRLYAFSLCHDLTNWDIHDMIFSIVKAAVQHSVHDEIVCKAICCCTMGTMWYFEKLDEYNPDKEQMKELKKKHLGLLSQLNELLYHNQERVQEEAYLNICDLLIVFSKHMTSVNGLMDPLVFQPDRNLQLQLASFLNDKVFIDEEDDDADENQKIEELHKRRNFLASFCKLIVYNVVHIKYAADMFKFYMKFYNDYGDIIKTTLSKSREINKVLTSKTLALSLTQLYRELQQEQGLMVDRTSEGFQAIKELARRFALSYGLDPVKNREAVAAMHKEGIIFSLNPKENPDDPNLAPPNLAFLEVLTEFTNKLVKQDKKTVMAFLDKHIMSGMLNTHNEDFQPLLTYRNSLVHDPNMEQETSHIRAPISGARGRKAKRKLLDETNDQWLSKDTRTPRGGVPYPLTSTAVKRRRGDDDSEQGETPQESEQGSEKDYHDSSVNLSRISQTSWLGSQKKRRVRSGSHDASYQRRRSKRPDSEPIIEEYTDEQQSVKVEPGEEVEQTVAPPQHSRQRSSAKHAANRLRQAMLQEGSPLIEEYSE